VNCDGCVRMDVGFFHGAHFLKCLEIITIEGMERREVDLVMRFGDANVLT
jgi:hypothetical protein